MTDTTKKTGLVLVGAKVEVPIRDIIETIAKAEERTVSKTVARLLKSHPEIKERILENKESKSASLATL
jgi:hypothetical protein